MNLPLFCINTCKIEAALPKDKKGEDKWFSVNNMALMLTQDLSCLCFSKLIDPRADRLNLRPRVCLSYSFVWKTPPPRCGCGYGAWKLWAERGWWKDKEMIFENHLDVAFQRWLKIGTAFAAVLGQGTQKIENFAIAKYMHALRTGYRPCRHQLRRLKSFARCEGKYSLDQEARQCCVVTTIRPNDPRVQCKNPFTLCSVQNDTVINIVSPRTSISGITSKLEQVSVQRALRS